MCHNQQKPRKKGGGRGVSVRTIAWLEGERKISSRGVGGGGVKRGAVPIKREDGIAWQSRGRGAKLKIVKVTIVKETREEKLEVSKGKTTEGSDGHSVKRKTQRNGRVLKKATTEEHRGCGLASKVAGGVRSSTTRKRRRRGGRDDRVTAVDNYEA